MIIKIEKINYDCVQNLANSEYLDLLRNKTIFGI